MCGWQGDATIRIGQQLALQESFQSQLELIEAEQRQDGIGNEVFREALDLQQMVASQFLPLHWLQPRTLDVICPWTLAYAQMSMKEGRSPTEYHDAYSFDLRRLRVAAFHWLQRNVYSHYKYSRSF